MNECSQYLPITVLRNTHSNIVRNVECIHIPVQNITQPNLINIANMVFESVFN